MEGVDFDGGPPEKASLVGWRELTLMVVLPGESLPSWMEGVDFDGGPPEKASLVGWRELTLMVVLRRKPP